MTYTNISGKPIFVAVRSGSYQNLTIAMTIDGKVTSYQRIDGSAGTDNFMAFGIVPNGSTYKVAVSGDGTAISSWMELR